MQRSVTQFGTLLSLLVLCAASGCMTGKSDGWKFTKALDVRNAIGLKKDKSAAPQIPTRLVSTWEDTVLTQVGKKPQRGFGGRILFFKDGTEDPVRVDGQLVVYAYDEAGREPHETHPTRRYVFPAEQFVQHESECQLGASYSVWLPWDETGGEQKNISLIARFEPRDGPLIAGDQTRHMLPGTRLLASGETSKPVEKVSDIQLTEFTETSKLQQPAKLGGAKPSPRVTSIALSRATWEKRLAAAHRKNKKSTDSQDSSESAE